MAGSSALVGTREKRFPLAFYPRFLSPFFSHFSRYSLRILTDPRPSHAIDRHQQVLESRLAAILVYVREVKHVGGVK